MRAAVPARHRSALLLAAPVIAGILLTGCGTSSSGDTAGGAAENAFNTGSTGTDSARAPAKDSGSFDAGGADAGPQVQQRAVISTGRVELTSGDVAGTRDQVDGVLTGVHGQIADENTLTDERGNVTRAHLVLRVPSERFDATMTDLAGLATLRSATRKAEDVTTQVIDTDARIAAQRAGVRRLRHLISRAANLPALLAVERELSARQGELESLLQQRAYLADRTSQATITVDISRHVAPSPAKRSTGGFIGGLHHGWHALVAVVVGVLVGVGAALPFALAGLVVGVPVWLVGRRFRRPRRPPAPAET